MTPQYFAFEDEIVLNLPREKATPAEIADTPSPERLFTHTTACGQIRGIRQPGWVEFRGVPYATAERFEQAVPVTAWEGVYDATKWGDRCCQHAAFFDYPASPVQEFYAAQAIGQRPSGYREDALELNIWAPEDAKNCPVLLYIHGGSYQSGSNTDVSTDGAVYAKNGVVVVSINYRLGVFATVNDGGKYRGNLAITDQITALRWVHEHIADFGGDPSRVTIMGESAGAVSVQDLLISPMVEKGWVSGAIMLSGGGHLFFSPTTEENNRGIWADFLTHMGVTSVEELKGVSAEALYTGWTSSVSTRPGSWLPCYNGISLTDNVTTCVEKGSVQDVPVIIGVLSEDCFPAIFYTAAKNYAAGRARMGGRPAYLFYFDRCQPGDTTFGAYHAADLFYAFGTLHRNVRPFDEIDYRISAQMISYFIHFCHTGDPNGKGLPRWVPGTAEEQLFLHFGDNEASMVHPDEDLLRYNAEHRPAFPHVKAAVNPAELDGSPISSDALLGTWVVKNRKNLESGSMEVLRYAMSFRFDEAIRYYCEGDKLSASAPYAWKDEKHLILNGGGSKETITIFLSPNGELCMTSPDGKVLFRCCKQ